MFQKSSSRFLAKRMRLLRHLEVVWTISQLEFLHKHSGITRGIWGQFEAEKSSLTGFGSLKKTWPSASATILSKRCRLCLRDRLTQLHRSEIRPVKKYGTSHWTFGELETPNRITRHFDQALRQSRAHLPRYFPDGDFPSFCVLVSNTN
jgi:hypothetical protein